MMSPIGSKSGFTLVEVVVSVVVLAVGVTGMLIALGRILEGASLVVAEAQATQVAQDMLAEVELEALARGPAPPSTGTHGRFQWAWRSDPDRHAPPRPLEIWTVTVTWPVRGQTRSLELTRVWGKISS